MSCKLTDKKLTPEQRKSLKQKLGDFKIETAKELGLHIYKGKI